jgi:hypothetical protein
MRSLRFSSTANRIATRRRGSCRVKVARCDRLQKREKSDKCCSVHSGPPSAWSGVYQSLARRALGSRRALPSIERHDEGRYKIEEIVPSEKLRAFRTERRKRLQGKKGYGEPDLFLYRGRDYMFVEAKRQDSPLVEQLICMAQIRHFLDRETKIVRVVEAGKRHIPKLWSIEVDLKPRPTPVQPKLRGPSKKT